MTPKATNGLEPVLAKVLPIYLVLDCSGSMARHVSELNAGLASLLDALQEDPFAASKARLSVWAFAGTARPIIRLQDMRHVEAIPPATIAGGGTQYASWASALDEAINEDVPKLRGDGYLVSRPLVAVLTDGQPTDTNDAWKNTLAKLNDPSYSRRPNILAFGMGDVDEATIRVVASEDRYAFKAVAGIDTGNALFEFWVALTQSVIESINAMEGGEASALAKDPAGFTRLDVSPVS